MKTSKLLALVMALVVVLSFSLVGCKGPKPDDGGTTPPPEIPKLEYADGTELRMATGYNNLNTGLAFDADTAGEGITLADGVTYHAGDLKPTWVQVQKALNVKITNLFTGAGSAEKEFKVWQEKLNEVDMVSGSLSVLQTAGANGQLVNIAEYLDAMPNFKAYLEANPIVRLSITGDARTGAIYFSPYFDGVNDIERMPLMRVDYLAKLLDGEGDFTAEASKTVVKGIYTPYMPTSGTVEVEVVKADASGTEKVVKNYAAYGNIIARMNAEASLTGVEAVNMLRDYIDATYAGYYGTKRSDLFAGQNAAWDADELAALLRCVVANPQTLNGTDSIQGLFSREDGNNQRRVDLFRFAGSLFGVRGLESRHDYLYFDSEGMLHDARQEVATYEALERMNALKAEGLISADYNVGKSTSTNYLEKDSGFMSYDYNQTQTLMNATKLQEGEKYMAVMVPVARWNDGGETEKFMRFTESWRSVKTDGWAISKAGVEGSKDKLNAALSLIDYAYSVQGQILMSYGPDAFIKVKNANVVVETWEDVADKYHTFNFNGVQMPMIAEATEEELWAKKGGNYTNYARQLLGSTLSFAKSQAFEVQCTHAVGREGAQQIAVAIGFGTIKHPELAVCDNMWYTSIPTNLPTTKGEEDRLAALGNLASSGKFSQSKNNTNCLVNLISGGWAAFSELAGAEVATPAAAAALVSETWGGSVYLKVKSDAWTRLLTFYAK
ncbi:MAG: hypothetical protein IKL77_02290 [Clostridia bacterium]|nr:hypothetical protein [Clostridia bacterium]